MTHPTTRVLSMLELLQTRREMTGPELAGRLGVDERTVRRYALRLTQAQPLSAWGADWSGADWSGAAADRRRKTGDAGGIVMKADAA